MAKKKTATPHSDMLATAAQAIGSTLGRLAIATGIEHPTHSPVKKAPARKKVAGTTSKKKAPARNASSKKAVTSKSKR